MQVKHLDHLNITVKNLNTSKDWYRRVFSFNTVEEGSRKGKRWAIIRAGEALLCLYENPSRIFLDVDELENREIQTINHFSLRIMDRSAWENTVRREGIPVQFGGAYAYPHSTSWYINDPTGYEIEVVYWNDDIVSFSESGASNGFSGCFG